MSTDPVSTSCNLPLAAPCCPLAPCSTRYCRADYTAFLDLLTVIAFLAYLYITVRFIAKFGDLDLAFVNRDDMKRFSNKTTAAGGRAGASPSAPKRTGGNAGAAANEGKQNYIELGTQKDGTTPSM